MKNRDFNKLLKSNDPQKIKEEYMSGEYSLTERQLGIICEKAGTGRGGCSFKYKPRKEN